MNKDELSRHNFEVKATALEFLRGQLFQPKVEAPSTIHLRVKANSVGLLLQHPRFRDFDTVHLHSLAKVYVKDRIPVTSREMAVAILLSAVESGNALAVVPEFARLYSRHYPLPR